MTAYRQPLNRQQSTITNRTTRGTATPFSTRPRIQRAERPAERSAGGGSTFDQLVGNQYANPQQAEAAPEIDIDPAMMDAISEALSTTNSTPLDNLMSNVTTPQSVISDFAKGRLGKAGYTAALGKAVGVPTEQAVKGGFVGAINPVGSLVSIGNRALPGVFERPEATREFSSRLGSLYGDDVSKKNNAISLMSELNALQDPKVREQYSPAQLQEVLDRIRSIGPEAYHGLSGALSTARVESRPYTQQATSWAGRLGRTVKDVVTGRTLGSKIADTFEEGIGPPVGSLVSPEIAAQTRPVSHIGKTLMQGLLGIPREVMKVIHEMATPKDEPFDVYGMSLSEALTSLSGAAINDIRGQALEPMFGAGGSVARDALGKTGSTGSAADAVGASNAGSAAEAAGLGGFGDANDGETGVSEPSGGYGHDSDVGW